MVVYPALQDAFDADDGRIQPATTPGNSRRKAPGPEERFTNDEGPRSPTWAFGPQSLAGPDSPVDHEA